MSKRLADKVAVVTGASKGIGAAIAKQLASEGASVVVNYSSSKEGADRVVAEIKKEGGKAVAVQADVAKKSDVERLFAESEKAFGRLDILVNNAGIYEFAPLEGIVSDNFHKQFDLNVLGLIFAAFTGLALHDAIPSRRGKILRAAAVLALASIFCAHAWRHFWLPCDEEDNVDAQIATLDNLAAQSMIGSRPSTSPAHKAVVARGVGTEGDR